MRARLPDTFDHNQLVALSDRQRRFVQEYLIDLNSTQAAIRAGYARKDADVQGPRLLGYVGVAAEIERLKKLRAARFDLSHDKVIEEWMVIAFSSINDYAYDEKTGSIRLNSGAVIPDAVRAVKSSKVRLKPFIPPKAGRGGAEGGGRKKKGRPIMVPVSVDIQLWDKCRALEVLSKHLGIIGEIDLEAILARLVKRIGDAGGNASVPPPNGGANPEAGG